MGYGLPPLPVRSGRTAPRHQGGLWLRSLCRFHPSGLWWHFHCKGWPEDFRSTGENVVQDMPSVDGEESPTPASGSASALSEAANHAGSAGRTRVEADHQSFSRLRRSMEPCCGVAYVLCFALAHSISPIGRAPNTRNGTQISEIAFLTICRTTSGGSAASDEGAAHLEQRTSPRGMTGQAADFPSSLALEISACGTR